MVVTPQACKVITMANPLSSTSPNVSNVLGQPVCLEATHASALEYGSLGDLQAHTRPGPA